MNLTQVASLTKKLLLYSFILLVALVITMYIWDRAAQEIAKRNPPSPPTPTLLYGKLPPPDFDTKQTSAGLDFILDTIEAVPPAFPILETVYPVEATKPRLSDLETAKERAKSWGFGTEPTNSSEQNYTFADSRLPRTIEIKRGSNNFILSFQLDRDSSPLTSPVPSSVEAENILKNILKEHQLFSSDLENGKFSISYLSFNNGQFLPANSQAEANAAKVDLTRGQLGKLPIVNLPDRANISAILSGDKDPNKRILFLRFTHWPTATGEPATYPIKTGKQVFADLKGGKGVVVAQGTPVKQIAISNIYLAIYDPPDAPQFLQPVVVFEGRNGFMAFLPAVADDWLEP
ncbi:hypothetical protein HY388_00235 [Candidatus Daviesbacteria bacterium]|nr:hypothetical protein [Candidatus Daviesbacteria bacterium]